MDIPAFFLSTDLSKPGDLILDPFCGSGTVLLEAVVAGRHAIGADSNPLARLLTRTKVNPPAADDLRRGAARLLARIPAAPAGPFPDVVNLAYWFYPHVRRDLLRILEAIQRTRSDELREFFLVALSSCIRDVSLADPRLSVPVRLRTDQYPPGHWLRDRTNTRLRRLRSVRVLDVFRAKLEASIEKVARMPLPTQRGRLRGIEHDARTMANVEDESIDLIVTSPPYVSAQKYIRATSLSLTWLGLCASNGLRGLEDQNIGREHFPRKACAGSQLSGVVRADEIIAEVRKRDRLRAHIAATYLREMRDAIREMRRVLKAGAHAVIIAGAGRVSGAAFDTPGYLVEIARQEGFAVRLHLVDTIRSRALMTKRHHTASVIDTESVILVQKERRP